MNFETYLAEQIKLHPSMEPRDVVKMCYQAAYGAEHLVSDYAGAKKYLEEEYSRVAAGKGRLYEQISDHVVRVNLSAWKEKKLPVEWLFRMFVASCRVEEKGQKQFEKYLKTAGELIPSQTVGFTKQDWELYEKEYRESGMPAVHHSENYREQEKPAYRIVNSRFCRIIPILEKIKKFSEDSKPCVIAIDGRAASGKTTLASMLQRVLDADLIHMDDFFVPPNLRNEERFRTPGQNIHYERFGEEVLPFIGRKEPFAYRIFDCSRMEYHGQREIGSKAIRIVEGSYSCHPGVGKYADITVFSDVSAEEQICRIRNRNGEEMLQRFLERWIPMEEEYFSYYSIRDKVELRI